MPTTAQVSKRAYRKPVSADLRFENFANRSGGPDACHPWEGATDPAGYGRFSDQGRSQIASRWLLARTLGRALTSDEEARHTCDNPPCVNARHLIVGSRTDNEADKLSRHGHYNGNKAECKRGHKLTGENLYIYPKSGARSCRKCRRGDHSTPPK